MPETPAELALTLTATLVYQVPATDGSNGGWQTFPWTTQMPPRTQVGARVWVAADATPASDVWLYAITSDGTGQRFRVVGRAAPGKRELLAPWTITEADRGMRAVTVLASHGELAELADLPNGDVTCTAMDTPACQLLMQLYEIVPPQVQGLTTPQVAFVEGPNAERWAASKKAFTRPDKVGVEFYFAAAQP